MPKDYESETAYKPKGSVLEFLYDEAAIKIEKHSKGIKVIPTFDEYYAVVISKEQLLQLAKELETLANEQ